MTFFAGHKGADAKPAPTPKKAKKPLNKVSKKRSAENKVYLMLREKFLRDNPFCAVMKIEPSTEVHHTYSGKDREKYFLVVSTWIAVSREGHNWIHNNPKESREMKLLK